MLLQLLYAPAARRCSRMIVDAPESSTVAGIIVH